MPDGSVRKPKRTNARTEWIGILLVVGEHLGGSVYVNRMSQLAHTS